MRKIKIDSKKYKKVHIEYIPAEGYIVHAELFFNSSRIKHAEHGPYPNPYKAEEIYNQLLNK